jgi:hypothetical protein
MATAATCGVCVDTFNKTTRKALSCGFCDFTACAGCTKRYILSSSEDAQCMSCHHVWSREFLDGLMPKKFVEQDYKKHREDVLFDRERALLPETLPFAENEKAARVLDEEMVKVRRKINALNRELDEMDAIPLPEEYTITDLVERRKQQLGIREKILMLTQELDLKNYHQMLLRDKTKVEVKKVFVRACPAEGCRGFLSTSWKCGLCQVWVCPECHEVKGNERDAEHTCDPNSVATAKLLAKDSKPCPKCATIIFKIEGCDQMWCTQCQTPFSWRTGQIVRGTIHNPHFYEYQRQRNNGVIPREVGDIPCGGMPHTVTVQQLLAKIYKTTAYPRLDLVVRLHTHIDLVEVPRLRVNNIMENRDLRIKYILQDIPEATFKAKLQQREKTIIKKGEFLQVYEMFMAASADVIRAFVANAKKEKDVEKYHHELFELRAYTNSCLVKLGQRYKCGVRIITDTWNIPPYNNA